jgi:Phospholipase_D-nuclease N-terminal
VAGYALGKSMIIAASPGVAGLLPALLVAVIAGVFAIYCLVDIFRSPRVRYLPRWLWAIICLISIPLGGIIYLAVGKVR